MLGLGVRRSGRQQPRGEVVQGEHLKFFTEMTSFTLIINFLCLNSLTTWPREGGRLGKGADAEEEPPAAAAEVDPRVW